MQWGKERTGGETRRLGERTLDNAVLSVALREREAKLTLPVVRFECNARMSGNP
jgi:hypothetical protein